MKNVSDPKMKQKQTKGEGFQKHGSDGVQENEKWRLSLKNSILGNGKFLVIKTELSFYLLIWDIWHFVLVGLFFGLFVYDTSL